MPKMRWPTDHGRGRALDRCLRPVVGDCYLPLYIFCGRHLSAAHERVAAKTTRS
jgi:hypothetical protein